MAPLEKEIFYWKLLFSRSILNFGGRRLLYLFGPFVKVDGAPKVANPNELWFGGSKSVFCDPFFMAFNGYFHGLGVGRSSKI